MKVRIIPPVDGVAATMSEIFGPKQCGKDEMIVRRGLLKHGALGNVPAVMAFCNNKQFGYNLLLVIQNPKTKKWQLGSINSDNEKGMDELKKQVFVHTQQKDYNLPE